MIVIIKIICDKCINLNRKKKRLNSIGKRNPAANLSLPTVDEKRMY